MKVIFKPIVLLFFCLIAFPCFSGNELQKRKAAVNQKADSSCIKVVDSISNNSININGQLNAVSITNDHALNQNLDTKDKNTKATNIIKINGDSNLINISQKNKAGNVTIQQNGKGNQVNVSQSNNK